MSLLTVTFYFAAFALMLIAFAVAMAARVHWSLRLGHDAGVVGLDHETLQDELTTHAHLKLIDPLPAVRGPSWWRRFG